MDMGLYREKALSKLSSPEQLDQLIQVVNPKYWVMLSALAIVVIIFAISLIYGEVPITISGEGIIMNPKGIQGIIAEETGYIKNIAVSDNNMVVKDQVIAEIKPLSVNTEEDNAPETSNKKRQNVKVTSPDAGKLFAFWVIDNDYVKSGDTIGVIETPCSELEALIFIPLFESKKIEPNMKVEISPSTINKENYGYLNGEVTEVGEYPLTRTSLMGYVRNTTLVDRFLDNSMPIKVNVKLLKNPDSPSGYMWSSGMGPKFKISKATLCSARIIVGEVKPISLFLPKK
jgi:hypothetical protein